MLRWSGLLAAAVLSGVILLAALWSVHPGAGNAANPPLVARASPSPEVVPSPSPSPSPTPPPRPSPSSQPSAAPAMYLEFLQSEYGSVDVLTEGGAVCSLTVTMDDGSHPRGVSNPQVATWDGKAAWGYPQSPYDGGGVHEVTCTRGGLTRTRFSAFTVDHS